MTDIPTGPKAQGDDMQPGEVLNFGDSISSANREYTLVFQSDGNLVLYRDSDRLPLWASATDGHGGAVCTMQTDGNLVVYAPGPHPIWATNTSQYPGSHLVVQDDGNVVIYRPDGNPVWATHTVQPAAVVDATSYFDKVTAGYQGWFRTDGDGAGVGWNHWANGSRPAPGQITFELYPDVREYADMDLYETDLGHLGSGAPARLFSSTSAGVVDTHFRWMHECGLDGVGLCRFVVGLYDPNQKQAMNRVASLARTAAEQFGRIFYIDYDISGAHESTWVDDIKQDWANVIVGQLGATSSPRYVHQDGKPLVVVWGLGFPDRPGAASEAVELISWLKGQGCFVAGGVPYLWREQAKPDFATTVYPMLDLIQPWSVGGFELSGVANQFDTVVKNDLEWTAQRNIRYQRVVFPGFAWSNWNPGPRNAFPRLSGDFFWEQVYQAAQRRMSIWIAMFDEYDEGTAIAKAAENSDMIPNNQYFLTLDADGRNVSSDFYLRLAGAATRMIKGLDPLCSAVPIPYDLLPSPPSSADRLAPNQALYANQSIRSSNGRFTLGYQGDGNLVLHETGAGVLWSSRTEGTSPGCTVMQADGNLVAYNRINQPLWSSRTVDHPGASLTMQNDGNLVIYRPDGTPLWATHTVQP
jgi:hypothetical protein